MNIYRQRFTVKCPNNDRTVSYRLKLRTSKVIKVEDIQIKCEEFKAAFHEDIADLLLICFGGEQTIKAFHHGTHITTIRGRL